MVVNQETKWTVSHPQCIKLITARLSPLQRGCKEWELKREGLSSTWGKPSAEDGGTAKLAPLTYHKSPQKQ